ncbi:MAG: tetratricopeptide repeat protein [Prevotellaceae bacterium]|jgi:tetratricopeptide (TPR) repeat protein|nr:tetratricopeptide repeat protein [Prevotellaceae bacterium]
MRVISLISVFLISITCSIAGEIPADTLWNRANNNYSIGNYKEAAQLYEQILDENGESAEIYFNLGNACLKQNQLGAAHLNYERARRLDPTNPDILYNLDFVKALQIDKIDEVQDMFITTWLDNVMNIFSENTWSTVFFALIILSLLLLAIFIFSQTSKIRKLSFSGFCLFILLSGMSLYFGYRQRNQTLNRSEAIVYSSEIVVKSTPNNSGSDLFIIHEGLKVKIIDKQGNYYRIILNDGKSQGWIPRESVEII